MLPSEASDNDQRSVLTSDDDSLLKKDSMGDSSGRDGSTENPSKISAARLTTTATTHVSTSAGLTTWTYQPVWPREGLKQRALGPIASSRDVPDSQIVFSVAPGRDMNYQGPNIAILDDAWAGMPSTNPARAMLVEIQETSDEAKKRQDRSLSDLRDTKHKQNLIFLLFSLVMIIITVLATLLRIQAWTR